MAKLTGITLKNFKTFDEQSWSFNFDDCQLILLDGPNGYGKTSIFDAIELALTGDISRLISLENRQNPADIVVAHNGNEDIQIMLEFDNRNAPGKFLRNIKHPIQKDSRKISKFRDLWQVSELVDGEWKKTSPDCIARHLKNSNFSRDFNLFHYIQQEEASAFLKSNNETQRAEKLSKLFGDTKSIEEKLEHLVKIQKKIENFKREVQQKSERIKAIYNIANVSGLSEGAAPSHFFLLPKLAEADNSPDWDKLDFGPLTQDKLNNFLAEVNHVKSFVLHRKDYFRTRSYARASQQLEPIRYFIQSFIFLDNTKELADIYKRNKFLQESMAILKAGDISQIKKIDNIEKIFAILERDNFSEFENKVSELLLEENKNTGLNALYSEIISNRSRLSAAVTALPDGRDCLLCGHSYEDHDALANAVLAHGELLKSLLSDQAKLLVETRDAFNKNHLQPLISNIASYLERNVSLSDADINNFNRAQDNKDRLIKLHVWLKNEKIEFEDLLIRDIAANRSESIISALVEKLSERIRAASGTLSDEYHEANTGNVFDRVFRDYFLNDAQQISEEILDLSDLKSKYIKDAYFSSLQNIVRELKDLERRFGLLRDCGEKIGEIIPVLRSQIRQYRKKLITDIEIPFYIYSGKILQMHQAGLGQGIFIKDPTGGEELRNVRLVSDWKSDHDILNTMSSGQISAVVISLSLALNKVYSKTFSTILIDDPVQTMDDINMSSFVELLRNEFSDRQIILSTHEENVSRYFAYKFMKHGRTVKKINVMERKEFVPKGNYVYG